MSSGACTAVTDGALEVVCDAGPLIHLAELECLDLLTDFRRVSVPEQVEVEVARHRPEALRSTKLNIRSIEIPTTSRFQATLQAFSLDQGEQAALALALETPGAAILTDDAAARLAAKSLGVRTHGTIGVLLRAIRRERRSREQVVEILRHLPVRSTLHIKKSLLQEILQAVQEGL